MKSFKLLLLFTALVCTSLLVNQSVSNTRPESYACLRVRTVPGTSDQKKKDATHSTTVPKPAPTSKSKANSGFFCSETGNLKTKLAVIDGGAPK